MSCCQPTFHYVPLLADMLGTTDCLSSTLLQNVSKGVRRNGSASDSRSEGWEFESLCPQYCVLASLRRGHAHLLCIVPILTDAPRKEAVNICAAARECRAACSPPPPGQTDFWSRRRPRRPPDRMCEQTIVQTNVSTNSRTNKRLSCEQTLVRTNTCTRKHCMNIVL
jgi:hypothetical protein